MAIIHLSRLHNTIVAGGVPIAGVDENGLVNPAILQKDADPIIQSFDDSDEAEEKRQVDDASKRAKALMADPKSEFYHLNIALGVYLGDEIKVAVPAYVPPTPDEVKQGTIDKVDEVKPDDTVK